jgi:hypothetical protein
MKSIVDILDSKLTLGFSYFYGLGDDHGYLRRMLYSNPSLEEISAQLKDDIDFIESADEDYFMDNRQLKSFKKLKKHISKASDYVTSLLKKKSGGSKWEKKQIEKEIRSLDKDLRAGLIDQDDYDYAIKMLLKPASDDLGEVKSKFEEIDRAVKQELKKVGFEEENPDEDMEDEGYVMEPEIEFESATYDIDKLVDEDHRRYSFGEYADIYEDVMAQQVALKNKMTTDPVARANNMKAQKIRQDRIKNLITKKKLPPTIKQGDLDKMTDEQLAGLENA